MSFRAHFITKRHIHPVHGPSTSVSSSILVFISHGLQLAPVFTIMVDSGWEIGAFTQPGARSRHHYTNTDSQPHSGISRHILTDQPSFQYLSNCGSLQFSLPFSTFHHANLVTTFLVSPSLFASSLLYCWSHHYLQTYHITYKNILLVTLLSLPSFLSSSPSSGLVLPHPPPSAASFSVLSGKVAVCHLPLWPWDIEDACYIRYIFSLLNVTQIMSRLEFGLSSCNPGYRKQIMSILNTLTLSNHSYTLLN